MEKQDKSLLVFLSVFLTVFLATGQTSLYSVRAESIVLPTDTLCPVCLNTLPELLQSLEKNATDQQIVQVLDKICDIIPDSNFRGDCLKVVLDIVAALDGGGSSTLAKYSANGLCSSFSFCVNECCESPDQPEQIHVAVTSDPTVMRVQWATLNPLQSVVQYTSVKPDNYEWNEPAGQATGSLITFSSGGWKGWIHNVTLTGLQPSTTYYYRVGDPDVKWSVPLLYFTTPPAEADVPINVIFYADMGATDVSDPVMRRVSDMVDNSVVDLIVHNGDISYADGYEALGDHFMRKIETVAAYVPYMVVPGNHEDFFDFTPYKNRFTIMPWEDSGGESPMYYSFDYGPAHFVAFSTEAPLGALANFETWTPQYKWLVADLKKANENRATRPWLIATCHRPLYCSNYGTAGACEDNASIFRAELEQLFYEQKVDLVITGHVHAYERTYPVYNGTTYQSYENPQAPIYLLNGAAGNKEQLEHHWWSGDKFPEWSANRFAAYGFAQLQIINSTMLTWNFYAANNNTIIDTMTVTKPYY
eukprot:TRINITY_DN2516_c0_g2_i1.p1 TRINITY_DN2516_c0_g2~~TRINITY_DN2516_c0_g2_i1.p1  ORF type:complete len:532 (+),score=131.78 TRINITY_DN2516_c0_g2_i1:125-1720(+)